jgi:hypothetical protein
MLNLVDHLQLRQEENQFVSHSDIFACSSWLKFSYVLLAVSSAVGMFEVALS